MTNIMSLKADVHYWWVPFTLWRRLALKDYWANRAPEKTCTPQPVIGALIEGITWEPRLLSEAADCCHCQKCSTKSSRHGRMSHRGRRQGRCLRTAHLHGSLGPAPCHPSPRWPQGEERQLYVLRGEKRLQTFSCDAIKYLAFKSHLSFHSQLRNVSMHMFKILMEIFGFD